MFNDDDTNSNNKLTNIDTRFIVGFVRGRIESLCDTQTEILRLIIHQERYGACCDTRAR